MKYFIYVILTVYSFNAFAECDFKSIKPLPDGGFEYSKECHLKVGEMKKDEETKEKQFQDLNEAIALKNKALMESDSRIALWQKNSDDTLNRLNTIRADEKHDEYLAFGLGVLTTFLSAYAASKLIHP